MRWGAYTKHERPRWTCSKNQHSQHRSGRSVRGPRRRLWECLGCSRQLPRVFWVWHWPSSEADCCDAPSFRLASDPEARDDSISQQNLSRRHRRRRPLARCSAVSGYWARNRRGGGSSGRCHVRTGRCDWGCRCLQSYPGGGCHHSSMKPPGDGRRCYFSSWHVSPLFPSGPT